MNKDIAQKWIDALRSGDYKQGANYLKRSIGELKIHCCLGVLCELYNESNEKLDEKYIWDSPSIEIHVFDGSSGALPSKVMNWAEIRTEDGSIGDITLTRENDLGKPFTEIANTIEKYWRQL